VSRAWTPCLTAAGWCMLCCVLWRLQVENSMRAAMSILQGSFDPIMDAANNLDLLPLIIQAKVGAGGERAGMAVPAYQGCGGWQVWW